MQHLKVNITENMGKNWKHQQAEINYLYTHHHIHIQTTDSHKQANVQAMLCEFFIFSYFHFIVLLTVSIKTKSALLHLITARSAFSLFFYK